MKLYMISSIISFLVFSSLFNALTCLTTSNIKLSSVADNNANTEVRTYIIHLAKPKSSNWLLLRGEELERWHKSFLPNTTLDSGEPRLIYSYSEVLTGFAARLTAQEVQAMQDMDGFLHAQPDIEVGPMTMYTPRFLGLSAPKNGLWYTESNMGEGVIIGVIDSGIPRNHSSFGDDKMTAKPLKWKGTCTFGNLICNKKIIGAVTFEDGLANKTKPPVDTSGHGSHVASIAAGNFVKDAMFSGNFKYIASGTAPRAHLAIYMITGRASDHLKAFDQSIMDGVDIINFSQGVKNMTNANFKDDPGALGGYKAVQKGISIAAAAGNSGDKMTLRNSAPWLTVVGASTTDQRYGVSLKLGNGLELAGETSLFHLFNASITGTLIYPGANNKPVTSDCLNGSLNGFNVKNKIVMCRTAKRGNVAKGRVVLAAGGAAMILLGTGGYTSNDGHVLPVCRVDSTDVQKVLTYFKSPGGRSTPTANITYIGLSPGRRPAPEVCDFSSRGPSLMNGGILKPDVLAPGYEILGASPVRDGPYNTYFRYDSGTSMATPHVSGVMALIKKKYPTWSPAAIQSSIITSADDVDLSGGPIVDLKNDTAADIFTRGAGHLNPRKAMYPGLVYDRNFSDYVGYMCGLGLNSNIMQIYNSRKVDCTKEKKIKPSQLNYPSILVTLSSSSPNEIVKRTVTNVGTVNAVYTAKIVHPINTTVRISPNVLQFSTQRRQASFNITITSINPTSSNKGKVSAGKLEWVSPGNNIVVRSPIAVVFG